MLPSAYGRDGCSRHAEPYCQVAAPVPIGAQPPNFHHHVVSKFRPSVPRSFDASPRMAFRVTVPVVFEACAEKQVRRLNTSAIVATVTHKQPVRYLSISKDPRYPMRPKQFAAHLENAVAAHKTSRPFKAPGFNVSGAFIAESTGIALCQNDISHVDLRSGSQVRPGGTLARLPGRSHFITAQPFSLLDIR